MSETPLEEKNGATTLAKLLNQLNIPTLAAVLLMGGGNLFTTKRVSDDQRADILKAVHEIHELHDALGDFEKRQKELLTRATDVLENQNQLLRNQSMMISNQQQFLAQLSRFPEPAK